MLGKLRKKTKDIIYDYLYIPLYFWIVYVRDLRRIRSIYGNFECLSEPEQKKYTLTYQEQSKNVSGVLVGEIVKSILDLGISPQKVLLDGDSKSVVSQFRARFNFLHSRILTTGIEGDYDYIWNFEDDPPSDMPNDFDLAISQAMLEHLLDPYKHFEDLAKLTKKGGIIMLHTHLPGYTYHRYPIDAVRFFPDWFEMSAKKLGLKVKRKFMRNFHLIYVFEKL